MSKKRNPKNPIIKTKRVPQQAINKRIRQTTKINNKLRKVK